MEIKELNICELDEVKDQTWGTGINKRLVLVGLKLSGGISEDEKHALLAEAWKRTSEDAAYCWFLMYMQSNSSASLNACATRRACSRQQ